MTQEPKSLSFLVGQLEGALSMLEKPQIPMNREGFVELLREVVGGLKGHRG